MPKLKFVHVSNTQHGREVVYFRRDRGAKIRLPEIGSRDFRKHYDAAMAGNPIPHVRDMPVTPVNERKRLTERVMRRAIASARIRSQTRGLEFNLTLDWALSVCERQSFRCAMTGIEFCAAHTSNGKVNPYTPSLDRIDPRKGYTTDNVRIVILAINLMLMDWGPVIFEQVANSYRYWKRTKDENLFPHLGIQRPHLKKSVGKSI